MAIAGAVAGALLVLGKKTPKIKLFRDKNGNTFNHPETFAIARNLPLGERLMGLNDHINVYAKSDTSKSAGFPHINELPEVWSFSYRRSPMFNKETEREYASYRKSWGTGLYGVYARHPRGVIGNEVRLVGKSETGTVTDTLIIPYVKLLERIFT